jgi:hypothetical protein
MAFGCKYIHTPLAHSVYGNGVGGALAPATGYTNANLGDGTVERSWRSSASATTHNIAIDLGSASWTALGVFDVKATDGTAPTLITVDMGTNLSTWAGVDETITLNTDGDGWIDPTEAPSRYVLIVVTFASAKTLRVGEVFAGTYVALSRAYSGRRDSHDWHVLENVTPAGTRSVARLAGRSRVLALEWDALLSAERTELLALWSNTSGGTLPVVLIPNVDAPTDVLHGTIPAVWSEEIDVLYTGVAFDFVQSGRAA